MRISRLLLTLSSALLLPICLLAQDPDPIYKRGQTLTESLMPPSPEPAAAVKYAGVPFTPSEGVAELDIPIYTMQGRELAIPIALAYRSGGIRLDEVAGTAGLGWSLQAGGCVTRTVVDMPDEFSAAMMTHGLPSGQLLSDLIGQTYNSSTYAFLRDVLQHKRDTGLDRYDYSVYGLSGSFYILDDGSVFQLAGQGVEITYYRPGGTGAVASFTLTGPDGTEYYCSEQESCTHCGSANTPFTPGSGQADQWTAVTAWHLTSVTSPSRCETATFSYADGGTWNRDVVSVVQTCSITQGGPFLPTPATGTAYHYLSARYATRVLTGISLAGFTATLSYASGTGNNYHRDTGQWASRANCPQRLSGIDIRYGTSLLQRVEVGTQKDASDGRIVLGSLRFKRGASATPDDRWDFTYDTRSHTVSRFSQDWYGYYNAENEGSSPTRTNICPFTIDNTFGNVSLAYGAPDSSEASYMSLVSADHDGAVTEFTYEGRTTSDQNPGQSPAVGLRVKSIAVRGSGSVLATQRRRFTYTAPTVIGPASPLPELYTTVSCNQELVPGVLPAGVQYAWSFAVHETAVCDAESLSATRVVYGTVSEEVVDGALAFTNGPKTVSHYAFTGMRLPPTGTIARFPSYWEDEYDEASAPLELPIAAWTGVRDSYAENGPDSPALLTRRETYAWNGTVHDLVLSEDFTYPTGTLRHATLVDYRVTQVMQRYQSGQLDWNDMYHYPVYAHDAPGCSPSEKVTVGYHPGGNDTAAVYYSYAARSDLASPERLEWVSFPGADRTRFVAFTYPDTWVTGRPAWAASMEDRHILSVPVRTRYGYSEEMEPGPPITPPGRTSAGSNHTVTEIVNEYAWFTVGLVQKLMPSRSVEYYRGTECRSSEILARDANGQPAQIKEKGRPLTFLTWGYGGLYPTAISQGTGSGALTSSYTFLPGVGMTSATDPSGIVTEYDYDYAGRLTAVRDGDGNTMEEYAYDLMADAQQNRRIRHRTYRNEAGTVYGEQVGWWDVLGLHRQDIALGAAGDGRDLVSAYGGDYMLHDDALAYLPYPSPADTGAFRTWAASQCVSFHGDPHPYSTRTYEESTRDRVLRTALPGYATLWEDSVSDDVYGALPLLEWVDSLGGIVRSGDWPSGQIVEDILTDADGRRSSRLTDRLGRTLAERRGESDGTLHDTSFVLYVYDRDEHLRAVVGGGIALTDTLNQWRYGYDALGRLSSRGLPGCAVRETYAYDSEDRIVSATRADGLTETEYDAFGRVVRVYHTPAAGYGSYPRTLVTEHCYDSETADGVDLMVLAGEPALWAGPKKGLETYRREVRFDGDGGAGGYACTALRYDPRGRPAVSVTSYPDGGILAARTAYDFAGDPVTGEESFTLGSTSHTVTRTYDYDRWGRVTASTATLSGSGITGVVRDSTSLTYDALGRVSQAASLASTTAAGSGDTLRTGYTYTLQGWMSGKEAAISGAPAGPAYCETLSYDAPVSGLTGVVPSHTGKITVRTDTLDTALPGSAPYTRTLGYAYDRMARLSSAVDAPNHTDYTYDQRGNILTRIRASRIRPGITFRTQETYSYAGDRITGIVDSPIPGTSTFAHDTLGRMVSDGRAGLTMEYNHLDKPRKVIGNGGTLVKYCYLAGGTLAEAGSGSAGGDTLVYRGSLIYRKSAADTLTLESVTFDGGRLTPDGVRYHVTDHLGSVVMVVDGVSGTALEGSSYGEYGARTSRGGTPGRYHFSGKEDQSTEWDVPYTDFGARHYSPSLRRWLTIDPRSEKYYGLSPYAYCAGDPVNCVDPRGDTLLIGKYEYRNNQLLLNNKIVQLKSVQRFVKKCYNALITIASTSVGNSLLKELTESEYVFSIKKAKESSFKHDSSKGAYAIGLREIQSEYDSDIKIGSGGTIYWSPKGSILPTTDGATVSAVTDLGHELFHAQDANQGKLNNQLVDGIKKDEWQAVYKENLLRQELRLPYRTHYIKKIDALGNFIEGGGPPMLKDRQPIRPKWYE